MEMKIWKPNNHWSIPSPCTTKTNTYGKAWMLKIVGYSEVTARNPLATIFQSLASLLLGDDWSPQFTNG